ncbi:hypothetical protein ACSIGC_03260 [Tenacibaculum sp. ZS6-P6]|uniref:hypothetical protein n=1 Tax=Tenacibaculum sp. ZS6-P6 TaxID=3447503 RepID=UPI003F956454
MAFKKNKFEITLFLIFTIFIYVGCKKSKPLDIDISYKLPIDVPINASQEELAKFAWQEFFALNWKSSWEKDNLRTKPDTKWNYKTDNGDNFLSVWETYIHRSELRPANGKRTKDLSKGKPYYTFVDSTTVNTMNPIELNKYWNLLDEDNEIGSAYVFAHKNKFEVLYAAKTNLIEYNYLKKYFPTDSELYKAVDKSTDSTSFRKRLKELSLKQMCDSDLNSIDGYVCLPCSKDSQNEGAIEIKLAFRELDPLKDDVSRYIVKEVVYFKESVVNNQKYSNAFTKQFALIGMHIIRKTKNHPTFIFASWEQIDERNKNTQTIGIDAVSVNGKEYTDVDPHRLNPVIERVIPETIQKINKNVHNKLIKNNNKSKWQYYQLIGVQGKPIDYKDRNSDNNYFMANYVIESDLKLTNFHGSFGDPFNTKIKNIISNGKEFNMGGCMGCHGQGQTTFGTDFSFLLDSGAGKPVIRPDSYQTYQEAITEAQKNEIEEIIKELEKQ